MASLVWLNPLTGVHSGIRYDWKKPASSVVVRTVLGSGCATWSVTWTAFESGRSS